MNHDRNGIITVDVTPTDLERAVRKISTSCAVATAIARTIPDAMRVDVDLQTIRLTSEGRRWVWITPYSVIDHIVAFDAGDEIEPFRFKLDMRRALNVRRQILTDEGRKRALEANRDRRAAKRSSSPVSSRPEDTSGGARTPATEPAPAPTDYSGIERVADDLRLPKPPRLTIGRGSTRSYGMRALRVNRDRDDDANGDD